MVEDLSYRVSFIFALILHLALVLFLFVKFTSSKPIGLGFAGNIINATVINERDFDNQMRRGIIKKEGNPNLKKKVSPLTPAPVKKPIVKQKAVPLKKPNKQLQDILQKNLLKERAEEIAELKKEEQKYRKKLVEEQEKQLQQALQDEINEEKNQLLTEGDGEEHGEEHGARGVGAIDENKALILQAISSNWIVPEGVVSGDYCQVLINVAPGGVVLDVRQVATSGNHVLERSAQTAILKASPLPVPEDKRLFDEMRQIKLTFKPEGIVGG